MNGYRSSSARSLRRVLALSAIVGATACASASLKAGPDGVRFDYAVRGMTMTMDAWRKLAGATAGATYESRGNADMAMLVGQAMKNGLPPIVPVDVVFVVDTTGSMQDDIDAVKVRLSELVDQLAATNPDYQCAVATYRDRADEYVSKMVQPLTRDKSAIQAAIASLVATGGGDWREHAYAGLDTALREPQWRPLAVHRIVLVGDAPPHESYTDDPRNFQSVVALARARAVRIDAIGVYCDAGCQLLVSTLDGVVGGKP